MIDRRQPATQEHDDRQHRYQDHVGVFSQEEHGECHARVFDHVAGNNFRFAFDHVKRMAIGFCQTRDEVHQEDRQQRQPVPRQEIQTLICHHAAGLPHDDIAHIEAVRDHQHNHKAKAHGNFIAHHLRRCTHRT